MQTGTVPAQATICGRLQNMPPLCMAARFLPDGRAPPCSPWQYTDSCPSVPMAAPDTKGLPATTQASLAR